jgi:hypothetical protein
MLRGRSMLRRMNHRLRAAIAALAIVLAGATLTACGDKDNSKSDPSTPKASSTASGDLTKTTFFSTVTAAQLKARTAHMSMAIGAGGQTIKAEGDVEIGKTVAGNSASMTMDYGAAGLDKLKMVLVDGEFYLNFGKITGNKYAKFGLKDKNNPLTKQFGQLFDQMDPSKAFKQYQIALKSFESKGAPVKINDVEAQPYQIVLDTSKLSVFKSLPASAAKSLPPTLTYVMYVGPDNLLRRVTYSLAGSRSQIDYSRWGVPVDIKAPPAGDVTNKDLSELFGGASQTA